MTPCPTEPEQKQMLAMVMEKLMRVPMENHLYAFNWEIRLQSSGGAIGDRETGAIATVFMLIWMRKLQEKLDNNNLTCYMKQVYVDDGNNILEAVPRGARVVGDLVVVDEEEAETDSRPADLRTAEIVRDLANNIFPFIKVTIDCPSMHESGFMPILDLQVRMVDKKVQYKFYKKPISSKYVILAQSALPGGVKRATLTQDAVRRLRNTDRSLPWSVSADILSEYSNDLRRSGYSEKFRAEVITAAIRGFQQQCEVSDNGGTPLYRPRWYQRPERDKRKAMSKEVWFRPNHDLVGFFPVTPGGELAKNIRQLVTRESQKISLRIKVVETSGPSLSSLITRPNLSGCVYPNCRIEGEGASHLRRGANNTRRCQVSGCESRYRGESGFGGHTRITSKNGHLSDIRLKNQRNSIAQHLRQQHPEHEGNVDAIKFKITHTHKKPLERVCREAVQLAADMEKNPGNVINGQLEFVRPAIRAMQFRDLLPDGEDAARRNGNSERRPGH